MSARLLDGRALAGRLLAAGRRRARTVRRRRGRPPALAIIIASGEAAGSYVKAALRACQQAGVAAAVHRLSPGPRVKTLGLLAELACDPAADAVLVATPYPGGLSAAEIASVIPPERDAEGLGPAAYGALFLTKSWNEARRQPGPCTAFALARLALSTRASLCGRRAVVVGRSATVGRPTAHLFSTLDMTVTLAHSRSRNLAALCREADLLVAAAGVRGLIRPGWIKRGAVVLDAGVHRSGGRLSGDVAPGAQARAAWLTPVPGGVGPVTTACAVLNAVALAERRGR